MGPAIEEFADALQYSNDLAGVAVEETAASRRWELIGAAAFYAILLNLPYWVTAHFLHFEPVGWFGLEYAMAGIVALYAPAAVFAVVAMAIFAIDVLFAVCHTFYLPVAGCLSGLTAMESVSLSRRLGVYLLALLLIGMIAASIWIQRRWVARNDRKFVTLLLLGFAVLVQGLDIAEVTLSTGSLPSVKSGRKAGDASVLGMQSLPVLARNPVVRMIRLEYFQKVAEAKARADGAALRKVPSAAELGFRNAGLPEMASASSPNVVLVLVESWGFSSNELLNEAVRQPYVDAGVESRYRIETGTVPFFGSTVAGESRELCGNTEGFHLMDASSEELKNCVVAQMNASGYRTIAVHGMSGEMFDRLTWYPKMGFQEILFHDDFRQLGMPDCKGGFLGTCDANIASWIGKQLDDPSAQPLFLHWVTLNSHLPLFVPSGLANAAPCTADLSLDPESSLCSWYQLVRNVHQSLVQIAMGNLARPTEFIIVGDHAPPFGHPERRSLFSQAAVPYIVLTPR